MSGVVRSKPWEKSHLVVSLGEEYQGEKIDTCVWDKMPRDGSTDVIIAYDIVDHLPQLSDIGDFLSSCRETLRDGGFLYLLCHPFKSRLGNHLFDRNLAYFHLVRGVKGVHTLEIDNFVDFYRGRILDAGLEIDEERTYKEPIEDFFRGFSLDDECEIQFLEYTIRRGYKYQGLCKKNLV